MKIDTILDFIDQGTISLPEFQRGYVWNRKQVKQMMDSLYRKYPVGSFLIWTTKSETANVRGNQPVTTDIKLLLDGQQRVTSLYGIIRGTPPPFFDGNSRAFEDLYFHIEDEVFEFYMRMKMQDNPLWINVTSLMQNGIAAAYKRLKEIQELTDEQENEYINRLSAIIDIRQREFHIDEVTGKDKNVDVVVEIFNKVNSGGTKLSQGDLAMAKICAMWPDARDEMKSHLQTWGLAGYSFSLDWLLRCINAVLTGRSKFTAFEEVSCLEFQAGMERTVRFINTALNMIASKLGLDNNSVLGGKFAIAAMARYLELNNGRVDSPQKIGKLLYWYTHSFLWGRYAGAVESNLRQDLVALEEEGDPLDNMIRQLRQQRGNLEISPEDFRGWSRGARFYPLLYMLTRMNHAKDWYSEHELSSSLLGRQARLHLHHIFSKAKLYKHEYLIHQVNALPNFTFLTEETNLRVSDRDPSEYLSEIEDTHPGILESHWIPMDKDLWKYENYTEFLEQRRTLLAQATNSFLSGLLTDMTPYTPEVVAPVGGIATDEEELRILEVCGWLEDNGLYIGELEYEILADDGETCIGILDVAWPEGIQRGLTEPVALLLDEPKETEQAAGKGGFRFFTSIEDLKQYVEKEILALDISDVS